MTEIGKSLIAVFVAAMLAVVLTGCAHCSLTTTVFDGKSKGFNPYGDGDIDVVREAYWGFKECILKLVSRGVPILVKDLPIAKSEEPIEIPLPEKDIAVVENAVEDPVEGVDENTEESESGRTDVSSDSEV